MNYHNVIRKIELPETASLEYKESPVNITIVPTLFSGDYYGRIGAIRKFKSKDGMNDYVALPVGTLVTSNEQTMVAEAERVFLADYRSDSQLVKLLDSLGCIVDSKFIPEKLMNLPVKFTIKENDHADANSKYKLMVTDIELIDKLPEHLDFKFYRVTDIDSVKYIAATPDAEIEKVKSQKPMEVSNIDFSAFDDDDENYFNFVDED